MDQPRYVVGKPDAQIRWLQDLIARRGYNRAAVALANELQEGTPKAWTSLEFLRGPSS